MIDHVFVNISQNSIKYLSIDCS